MKIVKSMIIAAIVFILFGVGLIFKPFFLLLLLLAAFLAVTAIVHSILEIIDLEKEENEHSHSSRK